MMKKLAITFSLVAGMAVVLNSCKKDDPPLPPITVAFQATEIGLDAEDNEATINFTLSRAETAAIPVTINMVGSGVSYGTDFTTSPEATGSDIIVTVPAGSTTASFKVTKKTGLLLAGTESIKFTIGASGELTTGNIKETILKFSTIVSEGSTSFEMPGNTGESPYGNMVFVDFSNNAVVLRDRKSWNLGFKSGTDFRVILNHAYQSVAGVTTKTDIAQVTEADAADIELNFSPGGGLLTNVDDWTGDLTKTAIAEIAANDDDNKVYLVASESNKANAADWFKVKITRKDDGYKVQYARLSETTIKTIDVPKKDDFNFTFLSLENDAVVDVEPKALNWDIQWGYSTYNSGLNTPYWFQDFIVINSVAGAQAAEVLVFEADGTTPAIEATTKSRFEAFSASNLSSVTLSGNRDAIGSKWRSTVGSGIRRDRFYIVKDPLGNIYKLRFISMGVGDAGVRGKPEIDFKLIKEA